ncbi:MAG: type VII secretion protein EccCb [Actinomycetota bacterium]|nr:type VII secretion protein EccCb [Actinomycetota bacterium]
MDSSEHGRAWEPSAIPPGKKVIHRPARIFPEPLPRERISVAAPPRIQDPGTGGFFQFLFPLVGSLGMLGFAFIYRNVLFLIIAGVVAGLMVTMSIGLRVQQKRARARTRARQAGRYRQHLEEKRSELEFAAKRHRDALEHVHPGPLGLRAITSSRSQQVWERRRNDPDFLRLRVGLGEVEAHAPVDFDLGSDPIVEYEADLLQEALDLVETFKCLPRAPVTATFADVGVVAVVGPERPVRNLARAMVAEAAVVHAPDDLRFVASVPPDAVGEWEWLKWLPHARQSADNRDDAYSADLAIDAADFEVLLSQIVRPRIEHLERLRSIPGSEPPTFQQLFVLVDDCEQSVTGSLDVCEELLKRATDIGVLAVVLVSNARRVPSTLGARIDVSESGAVTLTWSGQDGERVTGVHADLATVEICEKIAHDLTPLRLRFREDQVRKLESRSLLDLLDMELRDVDPDVLWGPKAPPHLLSTPIGIAEDGSEVRLDLKESAEDGMGPHGLIVGATGSGKSELLRTLVTGLALTHSPEELSFVFVDYKGGATFAELARIPHSAGMITNIERDLTLVDRMHEALFGELERRQRLLQAAGRFDRARDYQEHWARHPGQDLPALPSLLVVVDEFGELLTRRPDFLELFVSIGRTGRSLGVHLLLSTQRLDEGRIRGLEGHLRYRICLRTFSAEESMIALGTRDAFEMPPLPGLGYLRVDGTLQHFKAALASRPYREHKSLDPRPARLVRGFDFVKNGETLEVVLDEPRGSIEAEPSPPQRRPLQSEMQMAVERLADASEEPRARQVWLPPLPAALTLDYLSEAWEKTAAPGEENWLQVPIGVADRPRDQDQRPLALSFAGSAGHLAVVGAPRSGKSTLLQTLATSLALTHDPADVQVYAIDLGGGALHMLRDLPNVGEVYGRSDANGIRRLVRELGSLLARRAHVFREFGIGGIEQYHRARREGVVPDDDYGEVFLIVDNWALLVQELEDVHPAVTDLVAGGLHFGVHIVLTSNRWHDIRLSVRDNIGGRLELRLNDPIESEIDRAAAKALPQDLPGRGISTSGEQVQIALPRMDAQADISGLALALEQVTKQVGFRWATSPPAPRIKMLPELLSSKDVDYRGQGAAIGIEEFRLEPVVIAPDDAQPHLLVLGDSGCGKTNLLHALVRGLGSAFDEEMVSIAVVDYRRQLLQRIRSTPQITSVAANASMAADLASVLSSELAGRLPDGDAAFHAEPWRGPHLYLVVDDYDLVASTGSNPLAPLVDLVAQGRDIGFHIVLTRRIGGTVRSSYEPLFQTLVELGTPGLIMNGDPNEGPLLAGVKAQPLPPGRGNFVARGRTALVQTILAPDEDGAERSGEAP